MTGFGMDVGASVPFSKLGVGSACMLPVHCWVPYLYRENKLGLACGRTTLELSHFGYLSRGPRNDNKADPQITADAIENPTELRTAGLIASARSLGC